ncbi:PAS domain S-box protein, partial [candidate division KSB1 bacterium]
ISKAAMSTKTLDELFPQIHKSLGEIIDTTNFFISLYDKETDMLTFPYFVDEKDDKVEPLSASTSRSGTARIIQTGKSFFNTKEKFERHLAAGELKLYGTTAKVWLGVPLKIKDDVIGAMVVQSYRHHRMFSEKDIPLMEFVADNIVTFIDRKKADEALRDSEQQYRDLVEKAGIAICIDDKEGNFIYGNENYARLHGYAQKEILHQSIHTLVHPDDTERVYKYHNNRMVGKRAPTRYEFKGIRKDGGTVYLETEVVKLKKGKEVIGTRSYIWDISVRKKMEQTLRESEERYRELVEKAGIAILIDDVEGNLVYFNKNLADLHGYRVEEMKNHSARSFVHPEDIDKLMRIHEKRMAGKKAPSRYEFRGVKKDGTIISLEVDVKTLRDKDKITGSRAYVWDITERKKAEEVLRLTQFSIDHAGDAAFWLGKDANFIFANNAACESLEYSREELLSMTVHDIDPNFPKESWEYHWRDIKKLKSFSFESLHRTKSGRIFPVEISVNYLNYEGDEYNFAYARDITKRKQAEEDLKMSEEKFRKFIEQSTDGIILTGENGGIIEWNECAETLTGIKRKNILGKSLVDVHFHLLPDDKKTMDFYTQYTELLDNALKTGKGAIFNKILENTVRHSDGSYTNIHQIIFPIKTDKGYMLGSIMRDITDLKKAEEDKRKLEDQLFQSQKMESIGRLAGGIAHDFNNILTSILGYAELLKEKYCQPGTPQTHAAEVIIKSSCRAAELTQQLLGFARGGKYNPVPINANMAVREIISVSEKIFQKNIRTRFKLKENLQNIEADRNQLDQVLTNIIINASDAMPNGGELIFDTDNVSLDKDNVKDFPGLKEGNYVKIGITDTGIGMTEKVKKHIFEPFFTTKGKGTGLGLATTYGIIKNHDGYIDVESLPGRGTTFTLYFPATEKQIFIEPSKAEFEAGGTGTILVVDDEEDVRDFTKSVLETLGYTVLTAENGKEAVEIYMKSQDTIDLILLDIVMPVMGGREAFKELRLINPDAKILIISGYAQDEKTTEIIDAGALDYIQKPFKFQELSRIIHDLLIT